LIELAENESLYRQASYGAALLGQFP